MKTAIFWDGAIGVSSYYVKNKTAYSFWDHTPYSYHHSISPSCFMNTHNWNFLWDTGYFLNLNEFVEKEIDFPSLDLDVIFYACERGGIRNETKHLYSTERLRKKYPNAKIVAYLKEVHVKPEYLPNRIDFLKSCDAVHIEAVDTMRDLPEYKELENHLGIKFNYSSQPINIDYYYDNFYSNEKIKGIYAYLPNPMHRRGETYRFAEYISIKYNLPVKYKPLVEGQKFDYVKQEDFIKMWTPYLFHFNLDPIPWHPGGQVAQVAAVGSINIGGHNESHHILYPETATCDTNILEQKIIEYLDTPKKLHSTIQNAWNNLNKTYSFNTVKKQLEDLYG